MTTTDPLLDLQQIAKIQIRIKLIKYRMCALSVILKDPAAMHPNHREEYDRLNEELRGAKITEAELTYVRNLL